MHRVLARRALVAVLLALATGDAAAHAVLKAWSPSGPLAPGAATTITLTFNAAIETGLTRVVLRGAPAEQQLATHAGASASEVVVDVPPLPAGAYALHYKVLAVDGHVTESALRFKVAQP